MGQRCEGQPDERIIRPSSPHRHKFYKKYYANKMPWTGGHARNPAWSVMFSNGQSRPYPASSPS
ncbi:hypothetical protein SXCC_04651 [Gluconacetobacter sp. SXCC-1]|nr:hypothetical protein SXCC_04651 [Gluconacetobacter sp. SXCC-1]